MADIKIPPSPPIHSEASGFFATVDGKTVEIRDVWASNLEEEMAKIRELVEKYNYVAMVIIRFLNNFPPLLPHYFTNIS